MHLRRPIRVARLAPLASFLRGEQVCCSSFPGSSILILPCLESATGLLRSAPLGRPATRARASAFSGPPARTRVPRKCGVRREQSPAARFFLVS